MVPDIQMEGHPNITISVENTKSSKRVVTERDLPESAVFIDTIRPNISLIGNETYHIIRYSTLDQIPGATAYDGDPRYVPRYNLNISNIIDTDQVGSSAIYTYTAHTDAAGNLGYNVTRNVTVIASDPIVIETLTINSDNSVNSSYARAGNTITIDLTVDSTNFGNITASILGETINNYVLSSDELSLNKTITRSDTNGNLTFSIRATNSTGHSFLVTNENLTSPNIIIDTIAPSITLNGKIDGDSITCSSITAVYRIIAVYSQSFNYDRIRCYYCHVSGNIVSKVSCRISVCSVRIDCRRSYLVSINDVTYIQIISRNISRITIICSCTGNLI